MWKIYGKCRRETLDSETLLHIEANDYSDYFQDSYQKVFHTDWQQIPRRPDKQRSFATFEEALDMVKHYNHDYWYYALTCDDGQTLIPYDII